MDETQQELVENLARMLERSVAVDDATLRLLVNSKHYEDADSARLTSLVGRQVTEPLRSFVLKECRAGSWQGMHRLPSNSAMGLEHDRLCFPLRSRYEILGFMWVMDADRIALLPEEREAIDATAGQLQSLLSRRAQSSADADAEIEALVLGLLSADAADRSGAASDLRAFGLFAPSKFFVTLTVSVDSSWIDREGDEPAVRTVRRAFAFATQPLFQNTFAFAVVGTDSCLVVGFRNRPSGKDLHRLAAGVEREVRTADVRLAEHVSIGVGAVQPELELAWISFDQASTVVRSGRRKSRMVNVWDENPLEALLGSLLIQDLDQRMLPGFLQELGQTLSAETADMLEAYLDSGCSVVATSERLNLHRTSIYYRLRRVQETTGLDLEDGTVRLMLHLWLKVRPDMS